MNSFALAAFLEPPTTKITERKVFGLTFYPRPLSIQVQFCCLQSIQLNSFAMSTFFSSDVAMDVTPGRTSKNVPRQAPVVAPVARLQ